MYSSPPPKMVWVPAAYPSPLGRLRRSLRPRSHAGRGRLAAGFTSWSPDPGPTSSPTPHAPKQLGVTHLSSSHCWLAFWAPQSWGSVIWKDRDSWQQAGVPWPMLTSSVILETPLFFHPQSQHQEERVTDLALLGAANQPLLRPS